MVKKITTLCILLSCILTILFFIFSSIQCATTPRISDYGIFTPSRLQLVKGQDGCTPIDFDQRYTMWTFGDTITHDGMIANSLAFTEKVNSHNVTQLQFYYYTEDGRIAQFIKNTADENPASDRLWAFDGIRIGSTVYVYYAHVYIQDTSKPLSFTMKESSLAYWDVPARWEVGQTIHFIRKKNLFEGNVPALGASVLLHNGYIYVVGHISEQNKSWLIIARVDKEHILHRNKYEYLSGDSYWDKKLHSAIRLYGDVAGECSLAYDESMRSFCLVYCQLFTGNIVMCMAKTIEALPQAKKNIVYTPPQLRGTTMMYYSAKTILHENEKWYIIYINPLDYQPYLIKVYRGKWF
ncbi:MAG: DUF4185 domain-containing protein [Spirochaetota bacterium]